MDIFQYAMQMEKDAEAYYRGMEAKTSNAGLKKILTMLANEEVRHYDVLRQLRENEADPELVTADVFGQAKGTFRTMASDVSVKKFEQHEIDFWKKAAEIEDKARIFYAEKAAETSNPKQKALLIRLAEEEGKHQQLLLGIADFVTRPATWLEDAEWNHLENY